MKNSSTFWQNKDHITPRECMIEMILKLCYNIKKTYLDVSGKHYYKKKKECKIMAAMNVNTKEFQELLKQDKPVLVDFWATWCGDCRRIAPAYEQIAEDYADDVAVVKVNIDEEPGLAQAYRIEVIPTLLFFKGGQAVNSVVAPQSKAAIEEFINQSL